MNLKLTVSSNDCLLFIKVQKYNYQAVINMSIFSTLIFWSYLYCVCFRPPSHSIFSLSGILKWTSSPFLGPTVCWLLLVFVILFIFHFFHHVCRHSKPRIIGRRRRVVCFQLQRTQPSVPYSRSPHLPSPCTNTENPRNITVFWTKLDTSSKVEFCNVSLAVSVYPLQVTAGSSHVQEVLGIICDAKLDAKLFSFQIFSVQECHETASSIVHSICCKN